MKRSPTLLGLCTAVLLLWGTPVSWVALDFWVAPAYADDDKDKDNDAARPGQLGPGGQTIGGPGVFKGSDEESEAIHSSNRQGRYV